MTTQQDQDQHASQLQPAIAVVDSQNVKGWGRRNLGVGRNPSPAGIRKAMRDFGFDVQHCYVGLAIWTKRSSGNLPQDVREAAANYKDFIDRQRDCTALVGYFDRKRPEEGDDAGEKQVDVRLAIQVVLTDAANGQTVLLFTEDEDLTPAIEAARQRGVNVIRVVASQHFEPGRGRLWLLESSLRLILGANQLRCGYEWRAEIAGLLGAAAVQQFHVAYNNERTGTFVARTASGIEAVGVGNAARGATLQWYVTGVHPTVKHGDRAGSTTSAFPRLAISSTALGGPSQVVRARIQSRPSVTKAFLEKTGRSGSNVLLLPPGGPANGEEVLVRFARVNGGESEWAFVAAANESAAAHLDKPRIGTVLESRPTDGNKVYVRVGTWTHRLTGAKPTTYKANSRIAVWVHGTDDSGEVKALALSDPLD